MSGPTTPPAARSVVTIDYQSATSFSVHADQGGRRSTLVSASGPYHGQRPLLSADPVTFEVSAVGSWSLRITPLQAGGAPSLRGSGDTVSATFDPPALGQWEFTSDSAGNFAVWLHCRDTSTLIQNEIGVVRNLRVVTFGGGPCFWEVQAPGGWNIAPGPPMAPTATPLPVTATPEDQDNATPSGSPESDASESTPTAEAQSTPLAETETGTPTATAGPQRVVVANTDGEGVFLRATKEVADRLGLYQEGTVLIVIGAAESGDGRMWLPVEAPNGVIGWVPQEYTEPLPDDATPTEG